MIYDAMHKIQAEGVAVAEAHSDMEVFRLRLGKALNYEYNEDSQTGLFQRRDPREGSHLQSPLFSSINFAFRWACFGRGEG